MTSMRNKWARVLLFVSTGLTLAAQETRAQLLEQEKLCFAKTLALLLRPEFICVTM